MSTATSALEGSFTAGTRAGRLLLPSRGTGVTLSRSGLHSRTLAWMESNTANLVTNTTAASRQALRESLVRSMSGPLSHRRTARQVRSMIGLNRPQLRALDRYIDQLIANPELSARMIQHRINQRYGRMLTYRARMIAATEGQMAGNAGVTEYWRQAAAEGELDTGIYVQEWITRPVGACPICLELDQHTAAIGGTFYSPRLGRSLDGPTAHPWCYCGKRLRQLDQILVRHRPSGLLAAAA